MKTYGILKLTVTSPVQSLTGPITLAEAKSHLRIPTYSPADAAADSLLEGFITAAREVAECFQKRSLAGAQYDLTLDCWPVEEIFLSEELETVDLVQYKDDDGNTTVLVENTDYIVDTVRGLILPADDTTWPTTELWDSSAITIRYTTNPPAVSQVVKAGMLYLIAGWWDNRIPFQPGAQEFREIPWTVTNCLKHGAREVVA